MESDILTQQVSWTRSPEMYVCAVRWKHTSVSQETVGFIFRIENLPYMKILLPVYQKHVPEAIIVKTNYVYSFRKKSIFKHASVV